MENAEYFPLLSRVSIKSMTDTLTACRIIEISPDIMLTVCCCILLRGSEASSSSGSKFGEVINLMLFYRRNGAPAPSYVLLLSYLAIVLS